MVTVGVGINTHDFQLFLGYHLGGRVLTQFHKYSSQTSQDLPSDPFAGCIRTGAPMLMEDSACHAIVEGVGEAQTSREIMNRNISISISTRKVLL